MRHSDRVLATKKTIGVATKAKYVMPGENAPANSANISLKAQHNYARWCSIDCSNDCAKKVLPWVGCEKHSAIL